MSYTPSQKGGGGGEGGPDPPGSAPSLMSLKHMF